MRHDIWVDELAPEHCRICKCNKHAHGSRWTPDEYRDQIPIESIPHYGKPWASKSYHFYVPITQAEFKRYLLKRRQNVNAT